MSEPNQVSVDDLKAQVRERHCPGCKTKLEWFSVVAIMMPIEQATLWALNEMNQKLGWSVRTWGEAHTVELQFLAFHSICSHCTLISTWDFGVAELNAVLQLGNNSPARIHWNHNPDKIAAALKLMPEDRRPSFQKLFDVLQAAHSKADQE